MPSTSVSHIRCPNPDCPDHRHSGNGNIIRHGFFRLKNGSRRRRYRCTTCGQTFSSTKGTPYYRLQCTRRDFDEVATMRVEGVSISAIARIKGISWNTAARWLERASQVARQFNDVMMMGYELREIQADEIRTFIGGKSRSTWIITGIEVWSRLWTSTVLGRHSYRNIKRLLQDTSRRGRFNYIPLITADGFYYYGVVIGRLFKHACVYGQVIKTRRNNRVVRVERWRMLGWKRQLEEVLFRSEDSEKLNTSFIERLDLTIRQGSAYLNRKSPCHARSGEPLSNHLELLRCYYNFIRPHRGLRFGRALRTPAMQAGLVSRRLIFREVFTSVPRMLLRVLIVIDFRAPGIRVKTLSTAA